MKSLLSSKKTRELSKLFLADFNIRISIHMKKNEILTELNKSSNYKKLKNLFEQANLFHILGQTHTERWHSAFWSWLFDVKGSHNLKELPLQYLFEFLSQLSDEDKKPRTKEICLPSEQEIHNLGEIDTFPNEKNNKELTIDNSRFDTYISIHKRYKCIIEYKVDARFDIEQLRKYNNISKKYKWEYPIFIYVVPQTRYDEFKDFYNEMEEEHKVWFCLSFQDLYDFVIKRIKSDIEQKQDKQRIETVRSIVLIADYVQNMFVNHKGIKLAFGTKELALCDAIYKDNRDLLDELKQLYEQTNNEKTPESFLGTEHDTIMYLSNALVYLGKEKLFNTAPFVILNGKTIDVKYYYQVLVEVIDYFEEAGLLTKILKLDTDGWYYSQDNKTKRATIKTTNIGMDVPKKSKSGKYYIESKYGKDVIRQIINNLIKEIKEKTSTGISIRYVLW